MVIFDVTLVSCVKYVGQVYIASGVSLVRKCTLSNVHFNFSIKLSVALLSECKSPSPIELFCFGLRIVFVIRIPLL